MENRIPVHVNSQETVGIYLQHLSAKIVPPSLQRILSMLKATLSVFDNFKLATEDIQAILAQKQRDTNYVAKQAPVLSQDQIAQFLIRSEVMVYKVIFVMQLMECKR